MSSLGKIPWSQLLAVAILLIVLIWLGLRSFFPDVPTLFAGSQPTNLGIQQNRLSPCSETPNCVSSQSQDIEHFIKPLNAQPNQIVKLKEIIDSQPGTQIIAETDNYLYAQFSSKWLGFVDDVEFYVNPEQPGTVEVRSASRLGESDLGANRKRIETLRELLSN
ncbi:DUF1499 domain-containing protein [Gloeocapsa sp. PCC 73106]|uniref:DUF1499 domain-containing protein n=1 Tax=Gloeocapsa sp. PCC 73106 TaxID=102232 RepID=UPI0002ACEFD7|nr:DUF1499 domain-containing protein [Gloeocapsa sp. PCC 73106]ELR99676.1 hypothetical protein GLO73106DRAFT_00035280 [Gloeocapsa sp. PCC 73106]